MSTSLNLSYRFQAVRVEQLNEVIAVDIYQRPRLSAGRVVKVGMTISSRPLRVMVQQG
jgi:hypothetical protein